MPRRWAVLLLLLVLVTAAGCSARRSASGPDSPAAQGYYTVGATTTKMGTFRYVHEVTVRADGSVYEVNMLEATEALASFISEQFDAMAAGQSDYHYTVSQRDGVLQVRGTRTHDSLASFNEDGVGTVKLLNWPLYRTLRFDAGAGPVDDQTLADMFPIISDPSSAEWLAYLREAVRFDIDLHDEVTGKSFHWSRSAGQLGKSSAVSFTSKLWRPAAWYVGAGVGILLLGVVYLGLFGRRHWDTAA